MRSVPSCLLIFSLLLAFTSCVRYEPNWDSLDSRPLPGWYDEVKFGIFIHWGVFSVPAYGSEWFWWRWQGQKLFGYIVYMQSNYRPDFTYADFAPKFHAEFYDPMKWADIIETSGAKYVVLVSKHHEGYTNWPSKYSWNWNSMDVGPNRDLVGELADAIRTKKDVRFGLYHSLFEWFHPLFLKDQANGFRTQEFVKQKTMPELYEIVNKYKPEIVWSDGDWMALDSYWNSTQFISWLYNDSPVKDTVLVNDRWGNNTRCKHGGFWDCEDHFTPGKLMPHKWENCMPLDKHSWGYRANAQLKDYHTIEELLEQLVVTVSLGGNALFNIGPTSYGTIPPIMEERLRQVGSWMKVNGEAIYKSHVWSHQNDSATPTTWYTASGDGTETVVYAILLDWPAEGKLKLAYPVVSDATTISMVGFEGVLSFNVMPSGGVEVTLPEVPFNELPCQWAWTLKLTSLKNQETTLDQKSFSKRFNSIKMERDVIIN